MNEHSAASRPEHQNRELQVACHDCDLLLTLPALTHGETAVCPRCGSTLTTHVSNVLERILAFASAALIMLVAALSYPFLTLSAGGLSNEMTLIEAIAVMIRSGQAITAVLITAFVAAIPGAILVAVILLAVTLRTNGSRYLATFLARGISHLEHWSMVEVFIIGVIVSLVKIVALADVELGLSFWAYVAFSVLFVLTLANVDRITIWQRIERLE